jgi:acyl dehydratase
MSVDKKFIGKKYGPLTYEIGYEKTKEYADATFNLDPHYVDKDFAKGTKYGGIIAPPLFAVVYSGHICFPFFTDPELNLNMNMLVHGEQEFEFIEIVKPGDVLTSIGTIINIENKEKLDAVTIQVASTNQDGKEVCKATYTFVVRKGA